MRKILISLVIVALVACAAASAESIVATPGAGPALVSREGDLLTAPGDYADMYDLSYKSPGTLFAASDGARGAADEYGWQPMLYALMDDTGRLLTPMTYTGFTFYPGLGVVQFWSDGEAGVLDASGHELFRGEYDSICPLEGGFLASLDGHVYSIDASGAALDTGFICDSLLPLSDRACLMTAGGPAIIIDAKGAVLARIPYEAYYSEGEYIVLKPVGSDYESPRGLADKYGNIVFEVKYEAVNVSETYPNAPIVFKTSEGFEIFDPATHELTGSIEISAENAWAYPEYTNLISVYADGERRVYDAKGTLLGVWEEGYLSVSGSFSDGSENVLVMTSGSWPNDTSRLVGPDMAPLSIEYQSLVPASWKNGRGLFICSKFDVIMTYGDYGYPDYSTMRYGLVDEAGNQLLPMEYEELYALSADRFWAKRADVCGIIDETGHWYYSQSEYVELID